MKRALAAIVLWIMLASCKDNFFNDFQKDGSKLSEIYFDEEKFYEFEYNDAGFLSVYRSKFSYDKYAYSNKNQLISKYSYMDQGLYSSNATIVQNSINRTDWVSPSNTKLTATLKFEFDTQGRLVRSTQLIGESEFIYNDKAQIAERRMYIDGVLTGVRTYDYDEKGNLIKDRHYTISEGARHLSSISTYWYDDSKNPFQGLLPERIPGESTNENNITRINYEVSDSPSSKSDTRNVYTYNSSGYPLSKDNGDFVTRFRYIE